MIKPNHHQNITPRPSHKKQKESFMSLQQIQPPHHNQFFGPSSIQYHGLGGSSNHGKSNDSIFQHSFCGNQRQKTNFAGKIINEGISINAFIDDNESTKQFTRYDNYLSTQNLGNSFPDTIQVKNVRQSENIYTIPHNTNTPLKKSEQIGNSKNVGVTKSVTNLMRNGMKQTAKQVCLMQQIEGDSLQIKGLLERIKFEQRVNQNIKQQNIQLRLLKLSSNSDSLQMLSLKLQIQDLNRKIEKLKNEKRPQKTANGEYQLSFREIQACDISKDSLMIPNFNNHTKQPRTNQMEHKKYTTSRRNSHAYLDYPYPVNSEYMTSSKVPQSHSPAVFKNKSIKNPLKSSNNLISASKQESQSIKERGRDI